METERFSCLEEQRPKAVCIMQPCSADRFCYCEVQTRGGRVCLQFCHLRCMNFDDWNGSQCYTCLFSFTKSSSSSENSRGSVALFFLVLL